MSILLIRSGKVWNSSEWSLNDGPQGLQRLDYVLDAAEKHGIKVILAFTNNWCFSSLVPMNATFSQIAPPNLG